jgi:hypothetical protein
VSPRKTTWQGLVAFREGGQAASLENEILGSLSGFSRHMKAAALAPFSLDKRLRVTMYRVKSGQKRDNEQLVHTIE